MSEDVNKYRFKTKEAAEFFAKKLAYTLGPVEVKKMLTRDNVVLIDLRQSADFETSHIPGAISIPKDELVSKLDTLSKEKINIVYCYNQQCHLGAAGAFNLASNGYPVMEMEGGFKVWVEDFGFETEK